MKQEFNPENEFHGESRSDPSEQPPQVVNFISKNTRIGKRAKVWHFAVIQDDVKIGDDCSIGSNAEISKGGVIGDNVRIGHGTITAPNMIIGNNVFIGPNVTFCDDKYPKPGSPYIGNPPRVGDDVTIGAGAIILAGCKIEDRSVIGAGMIVTKDVHRCTVVRSTQKVTKRMTS